MSDDGDEPSIERLQSRMAALESMLSAVNSEKTRRDVLKIGTGAATATAAWAVFGGSAAAQSTGNGDVGSASNPALRVYLDRAHMIDLGQDPSSPSDGDAWYNSNA